MTLIEKKRNIKYSWIVHARLDTVWAGPIPPSKVWSPDRIWTPTTWYQAVPDTFALVPKVHQQIYFELDPLFKPNVLCLGGPNFDTRSLGEDYLKTKFQFSLQEIELAQQESCFRLCPSPDASAFDPVARVKWSTCGISEVILRRKFSHNNYYYSNHRLDMYPFLIFLVRVEPPFIRFICDGSTASRVVLLPNRNQSVPSPLFGACRFFSDLVWGQFYLKNPTHLKKVTIKTDNSLPQIIQPRSCEEGNELDHEEMKGLYEVEGSMKGRKRKAWNESEGKGEGKRGGERNGGGRVEESGEGEELEIWNKVKHVKGMRKWREERKRGRGEWRERGGNFRRLEGNLFAARGPIGGQATELREKNIGKEDVSEREMMGGSDEGRRIRGDGKRGRGGGGGGGRTGQKGLRRKKTQRMKEKKGVEGVCPLSPLDGHSTDWNFLPFRMRIFHSSPHPSTIPSSPSSSPFTQSSIPPSFRLDTQSLDSLNKMDFCLTSLPHPAHLSSLSHHTPQPKDRSPPLSLFLTPCINTIQYRPTLQIYYSHKQLFYFLPLLSTPSSPSSSFLSRSTPPIEVDLQSYSLTPPLQRILHLSSASSEWRCLTILPPPLPPLHNPSPSHSMMAQLQTCLSTSHPLINTQLFMASTSFSSPSSNFSPKNEQGEREGEYRSAEEGEKRSGREMKRRWDPLKPLLPPISSAQIRWFWKSQSPTKEPNRGEERRGRNDPQEVWEGGGREMCLGVKEIDYHSLPPVKILPSFAKKKQKNFHNQTFLFPLGSSFDPTEGTSTSLNTAEAKGYVELFSKFLSHLNHSHELGFFPCDEIESYSDQSKAITQLLLERTVFHSPPLLSGLSINGKGLMDGDRITEP